MTTTYNVNIVGSLTNNNGILGNFSTNNHALVNQTFTSTLSTQDWEFVIPYLSTDLSASQYPMCSDDFGIGFGINNNGSTLTWYISSNGSSWNVVSGTSAYYTFHTNTQYYFKLSHSSGTVYLSVSLDNNTYIQLLSASLTSMQDTVLKFGASRTNANPCTYGQIDLNKAYIKVNDVLWWKGVSNTSNITTKIQLRHDTAANWTSVNPVLLEGEVGIETDTKKQKIGDGSTPWNGLQYDLGSTALQASGGTMTGGLIIEDIGATAFCQKYPNITYNTAPSSSNTYGGFAALDTNLNWMGLWAVERYADNHTVIKMQGKSRTGAQGRLQLKSRTDGSWVAEAPTPLANSDTNEIATTEWARDIADGQPVAVDQLLTTSTSVGSYNIDISSYLPNDSYDYEIILNGEIYNSNSTYGQVWLGSSRSTTIIVSNAGTNKRLSTILAPLVVSTNREITMGITGHSIEWQNVNNRRGLYLVGYRRLGTNS